MRKKMKITVAQNEEFMRDTWVLFAAQTVANETLRWKISLHGAHLITHGDKELYRGFAFDEANCAWEDA